MFYPNFIYSSLIFYGVHVGHSFDNTVLYSAWLVWAFRQGIALINLLKFVIAFRASSVLIANLIQSYYPIWFINLDISMEKFVGYAAKLSGEHFTGSFWCRGLISNFSVVAPSFRKSVQYPSFMWSRYQKFMSKTLSHAVLGRNSWPRLSFISSVFNSYFPARESINAQIPTIGVVDTNTLTQSAAPPLPGNDDSSHAIIYYNSMVGNFILKRKFNSIARWFEGVKRAQRFNTFQTWFSSKVNDTSLDVFSAITNYTFDGSAHFNRSMRFYFSLDSLKNKSWFPLFSSATGSGVSNLNPKNMVSQFLLKRDFFYTSSVFQVFQLYSFLKIRYYKRHFSPRHFTRHRFHKKVYRKLVFMNHYRWYKRRLRNPLYFKYLHRLFVFLIYKTYLNLNPRFPALGAILTKRSFRKKRGKRLSRKLFLKVRNMSFRKRISLLSIHVPLIIDFSHPRSLLLTSVWDKLYQLWSEVFFKTESVFGYSADWSLRSKHQ